MHNDPSDLIEFYRGNAPTEDSKSLDEIINECQCSGYSCIRYANRLFPIFNDNDTNESELTITSTLQQFFWEDLVARQNILRALNAYLSYYGLVRNSSSGFINRQENFSERKRNWIYPQSPHFTLLDQIIRSLGKLQMKEEAVNLYFCLQNIYQSDDEEIQQLLLLPYRNHWTPSIQEFVELIDIVII
jgi:hypothetical protein